ncbi:MAG TPA: response regulator transcription factor [Halanaerobiales bacterium]|nr:response regulator transcription factor [Halanaerobiales bacterium]HPZ61987.1 response regulator transcription factor [Halanaerobiales bacterium]HQD03290.1 response regulator transcription factor [Halanaerobiales bacterium]
MINVLIIDSDIYLCESLKSTFEEERITVDYVHEGIAGIQHIMTNNYDLVIMELNLPDMDGLELVKYLWEKGNPVPVLVLSSEKEKGTIIKALDAGADDYITKPFHPGELLARMRALQRRKCSSLLKGERVSYADLTLNLSSIELSSQKRKECLTQKEFQLMKLFIYNPDQVLGKEMLISKIWPFDENVCYNTLEAHIASLRKKMKQIESKVRIVTVRGIGYKMEA